MFVTSHERSGTSTNSNHDLVHDMNKISSNLSHHDSFVVNRERPNDTCTRNNDDRRSRYAQLAVPCFCLSLCAIAMALNEIYKPTEADHDHHPRLRSLQLLRSLASEFPDPLPDVPEKHKKLLPLSDVDYAGFTCATLGLMIAGGGGIGGGGIIVPIYILVMGFAPKHAIPLSNVTVFGGAVANTMLNSFKRHPFANRPLVDWDLILVMEPLTIGGALIGAFFNKILPDELLVVFLVVLLSFTAKATLQKAFKMYRKESQEMLKDQVFSEEESSDLSLIARKTEDEIAAEENEALLTNDLDKDVSEQDDNLNGLDDESIRTDGTGTTLRRILDEESRVPIGNILILLAMFVVVLLINIMKGGGASPSPLGIQCGSNSFWAANIFMLVWIIIISLIVRKYLVKRWELKKEINYPYVEGDIEWDARATIIYPLVCCLAGFFAGMFGIGGGIVKGPLMLTMGVHPAVSSASSACMILFTSFTATTSFIVFGLLIPDYAPVCFAIGFVATMVGQVGLYYLMRRFNRNSFIAFSIGAVVLLSAFLMTIQSLITIAEGTHHTTGGVCGDGEK